LKSDLPALRIQGNPLVVPLPESCNRKHHIAIFDPWDTFLKENNLVEVKWVKSTVFSIRDYLFESKQD
jgi:hypothetical protein